MENEFFNNLNNELAALFNGLLSEPYAGMFRRQPEVLVGGTMEADGNYHLYMVGKEVTEADRGTFNLSVDADTSLVFRYPSVIQVRFTLCAQGLPPKQILRAQDRLMTFFFDNKMMEPLLPAAFGKYPALLERMKSKHAEIKVREENGPLNEFRFAFDYCGFYHSGNFVRQETRTKARVIEFANEANERSN